MTLGDACELTHGAGRRELAVDMPPAERADFIEVEGKLFLAGEAPPVGGGCDALHSEDGVFAECDAELDRDPAHGVSQLTAEQLELARREHPGG